MKSTAQLHKMNHLKSFTIITFLTTAGACFAPAQNLILNGDFTANAAAFTSWPGNIGYGSNPTGIADWIQIVGGGPVGVNGAGVDFAGSPFGPTTSGADTYAFVQNGVNGLAQNLASLTTDSRYQLTFDAANRAGDLPVTFRVQIGDATQTDFTTQVGGADVLTGNPSAFTQYTYTFTTTATFNGVPSIQLYNLSSVGTIDFANISLVGSMVPEPSTTATALAGLGVALASTWRRRSAVSMQTNL